MTFLEILEPLLLAAENYAAAVISLNDVDRIRIAELALKNAAIEFAKWTYLDSSQRGR